MNYDNRPKIDIPKTAFEKWFDFIAGFIFVANFVFILIQWNEIPDRVPTHFNVFGEADDWGGKGFIWVLPLVGIFIWTMMTVLGKHPHTFNYMVQITEENAERQYRNGKLLMNMIKNEIILLFSYLSFSTIQVAKGGTMLLGIWELPIVLVTIFGTITIFTIRSFRLK
ncbi:MAG TPA: DUF1648 domain-containing protein [Bacillus sp. (in: firmicutes)]|uniref:DUF1648 domain-containing protein n=1 Tax=Bacillus litorisediminis TaxID=2922713 RepID=UPI001FADC343|nr:DUF1648 domain-containing protein [Bacillus litorisediminis]HWO74734.1 DUF1648 domain-containing protein [Bacillus sp. (in: firmicutes)]